MSKTLTSMTRSLDFAPPEFEADLDPENKWPRMRFNFDNGWAASLVLRTGETGMDARMATLACAPIGQWGNGKTELGPTEAWADEAIAWIAAIAARPPLPGFEQEIVA